MANLLIGLVVGFIIGWVVKWIYDSNISPTKQNAALENQQLSLKLKQADEKIKELQQELLETQQRPQQMVFKEKDRLEQILGIGPVFANKLNAAGVQSFADLSKLSPSQIEVIIKPQNWQAIDPESWINQAKSLSESREVPISLDNQS